MSDPLRFIAQLTRAPLLGVTYLIVAMGIASANIQSLSFADLATFAAGLLFHVAVYGWNDYFDLPIDRTEPRRKDSPLVRGEISPRLVLIASTLAATIGVLVALLQDTSCGAALAGALLAMLIYDAFGKRARLPPVTDLIQGLGWTALMFYGCFTKGEPTASTWWLGLFIILVILLLNGVHGAVRDLPNDILCGARTTAIWLGARPNPDGSVLLTSRLRGYAISLHSALLAVACAALFRDAAPPALVILFATVACVCTGLLWMNLRQRADVRTTWRTGFFYIVLVMILPLLAVAAPYSLVSVVAVVAIYLVPWLGGAYARSLLKRRFTLTKLGGRTLSERRSWHN